jgi:hypothetical protein
MFLRRETFLELGGYAPIPLMEDIEISRRLRRRGRIAFVGPPVRTLPRRWLGEGALRTTLRDWRRAVSYTVLGAPPEELARRYKDVR